MLAEMEPDFKPKPTTAATVSVTAMTRAASVPVNGADKVTETMRPPAVASTGSLRYQIGVSLHEKIIA